MLYESIDAQKLDMLLQSHLSSWMGNPRVKEKSYVFVFQPIKKTRRWVWQVPKPRRKKYATWLGHVWSPERIWDWVTISQKFFTMPVCRLLCVLFNFEESFWPIRSNDTHVQPNNHSSNITRQIKNEAIQRNLQSLFTHTRIYSCRVCQGFPSLRLFKRVHLSPKSQNPSKKPSLIK
jgi:hypothetical protein